METEWYLASEAAQLAFGAALGERLRGRAGVVFLRGDLGAGKTTLVRGLLRALGHRGAVRSPTYTLMEPYAPGESRVFHLDLYRLGDPEELEYLGLRDLLDGEALLLVEWPERGAGVLPAPDLEILITHAPPGRQVLLRACPAWTWLPASLALPKKTG
ncbi:tRNA (adenosine(37)-N6)-threonylcarbamoyltransferase complex ATPase subunit type 1 TsaE [Thiohalocapsa marina]|uniref:tRNA threonylcarbamoyladenosine biosynthesis protein TsaE n=1 Tax=Thiohalocapsa marina TaxID=424902 RepID=A0A5M8FK55_9GAMM|nr:tRNA (adenosine(37)-N6)-threonylcarbamoyltransferase complex ATPase subunit type 1 TsaE [Thiohalocapsa marina]KAA6185067.1 tRNA (adenosine(37)-N6)-threonylcarbamoyltransferase complex ATPase subunit type 1 TsaE [Thiohalocapsa marina]